MEKIKRSFSIKKTSTAFKAALFSFCLLFQMMAHSQQYVSISGKIMDVETKAPLPFSTINIANTAIGVVANELGEFQFKFDSKYLSDSIVFSTSGYQSEKYLVQKYLDQKVDVVELVSKAVVLSEVVITDKKLTAEDILELVRKNIKNNYPTDPFEFKAFYRDYKIEDDECVGIFEAAASVYDKGYDRVGNRYTFKEKVTLEQVRKSLATEFKTHAFRRVNMMKELLKLNDVRYQTRALSRNTKKYQLEIDGYEIINDRLMYRIKAFNDWTWIIYVDVSSYAVPKIEMNFDWIDDVAENEWTLGDTIRYQQRSAQELLEFQLIDGLYYPRYNSFRSYLHAFHEPSGEEWFTSNMIQEYMVTDIDFNPEEKPEKAGLMDPDLIVEKQEFTYDPDFWKNYNVLKMRPRDQEKIQGLEKKMKLEDQFQTLIKQ